MDSHLTNIISNDLSNNAFSDSAKPASVRPIYKKDDRNEIKNYRPVSILNCFSKIYKKLLNEQLLPFVNLSISELMSAYRNGYSTNHVVMDLSKAFDCIPHDRLIAKLRAYGLYFDTVTFSSIIT